MSRCPVGHVPLPHPQRAALCTLRTRPATAAPPAPIPAPSPQAGAGQWRIGDPGMLFPHARWCAQRRATSLRLRNAATRRQRSLRMHEAGRGGGGGPRHAGEVGGGLWLAGRRMAGSACTVCVPLEQGGMRKVGQQQLEDPLARNTPCSCAPTAAALQSSWLRVGCCAHLLHAALARRAAALPTATTHLLALTGPTQPQLQGRVR